MNVGIWQGSTPERVHATDDQDRPLCHVGNRNYRHNAHEGPATGSFWRTWAGNLSHVDCRRCLRSLRAAKRRELAAIERRLAGKDGIQTDLLD